MTEYALAHPYLAFLLTFILGSGFIVVLLHSVDGIVHMHTNHMKVQDAENQRRHAKSD